ncbi:MAG TPA: hypothetical protein VMF08_05880 [Candidatus Sulfotelmatobacter sp.]|jgi:hypothetical protein|nr:hypothetical protein [Candidatus Sulfotelmatobacter sp.]
MNPLSLIAAILAFADPGIADCGALFLVVLSVAAVVRSRMP